MEEPSMKPALLLFVVLTAAVAACRCGPDLPTAVTVRVKNTLSEPIWVDMTDPRLGVELQRRSGFDWASFAEERRCECQACDQICRGCECDGGSPRVMKIAANSERERTWAGVIQESGSASCGAIVGGRACLREAIPAVDETLRGQLCYALGPPPGTVDPGDAGVLLPGTINPDSRLCVTREFRVMDGVVELSPTPGAACTQHEQCRADAGELCFSSGCTTSCPTHGFPAIGGAWDVNIAVNDMGFFASTTVGGNTVYTGTGTVSSAFPGPDLYLQRPAPGGGFLTAQLTLNVPTGFLTAFSYGETLTVKVVEVPPRERDVRAVSIRDSQGRLLFAADRAYLAPLLQAADTAPFGVTSRPEIVGCDFATCVASSKRHYHRTGFSGASTDAGGPLELAPGESATVVNGGITYKLLSVGNHRFLSPYCTVKVQMPYVIAAQR
jgi:hypothetical protein